MKSLGKAKTRLVWCLEEPKHLPDLGGYCVKEPNKFKHSAPNKVVCPECGKRFNPRVRECDDPGCWHVYVPAHKKKVKIL